MPIGSLLAIVGDGSDESAEASSAATGRRVEPSTGATTDRAFRRRLEGGEGYLHPPVHRAGRHRRRDHPTDPRSDDAARSGTARGRSDGAPPVEAPRVVIDEREVAERIPFSAIRRRTAAQPDGVAAHRGPHADRGRGRLLGGGRRARAARCGLAGSQRLRLVVPPVRRSSGVRGAGRVRPPQRIGRRRRARRDTDTSTSASRSTSTSKGSSFPCSTRPRRCAPRRSHGRIHDLADRARGHHSVGRRHRRRHLHHHQRRRRSAPSHRRRSSTLPRSRSSRPTAWRLARSRSREPEGGYGVAVRPIGQPVAVLRPPGQSTARTPRRSSTGCGASSQTRDWRGGALGARRARRPGPRVDGSARMSPDELIADLRLAAVSRGRSTTRRSHSRSRTGCSSRSPAPGTRRCAWGWRGRCGPATTGSSPTTATAR